MPGLINDDADRLISDSLAFNNFKHLALWLIQGEGYNLFRPLILYPGSHHRPELIVIAEALIDKVTKEQLNSRAVCGDTMSLKDGFKFMFTGNSINQGGVLIIHCHGDPPYKLITSYGELYLLPLDRRANPCYGIIRGKEGLSPGFVFPDYVINLNGVHFFFFRKDAITFRTHSGE